MGIITSSLKSLFNSRTKNQSQQFTAEPEPPQQTKPLPLTLPQPAGQSDTTNTTVTTPQSQQPQEDQPQQQWYQPLPTTFSRDLLEIAIRHTGQVILPRVNNQEKEKEGGKSTKPIVSALLKNIEALGYTLDINAIGDLTCLSHTQIAEFYDRLVAVLKKLVGANVGKYKPMYPNFPREVMEASKAELYINAVIHYWTGLLPETEEIPRPELTEGLKKLVVLKNLNGSNDGQTLKQQVFTRLLSSKSSLSATDVEDLEVFFMEYGGSSSGILEFIPETIPYKENVATVVRLLLEYVVVSSSSSSSSSNVAENEKVVLETIQPHVKTATDVLRIAVGLSPNGDVSLAKPSKFKSFSRKERRLLLSLAEGIGPNLLEDMLRHKEQWKRLAEKLHPGEYHKKYPRFNDAIWVLRKDLPHVTWGSEVERILSLNANALRVARLLKKEAEGSERIPLQPQPERAEDRFKKLDDTMFYGPKLVELLSARPGEFARRLDHVLRLANSITNVGSNGGVAETEIVVAFGQVADKVSTPVLLQVLTHFSNRPITATNSSLDNNTVTNADEAVTIDKIAGKEEEAKEKGKGKRETESLRTFLPKGNLAKIKVIPNKLPAMDTGICHAVGSICAYTLVQRFSQLPTLGKVYLDAGLADYPIPFSQRSASKSLRTVSRGSRIALPQPATPPTAKADEERQDVATPTAAAATTTVRFFIWWKENDETDRVDIDLSAVMYDGDWNFKERIAYFNLRSNRVERGSRGSSGGGYTAIHSGDVTSAPHGACEFIDIDIDSVAEYGGGRYILMVVNSYTEQTFDTLPECYVGWMVRNGDPQAGEIFEPRTVQDKLDVRANTTLTIPLIIDVVDRKMLFADIALRSNSKWANNVLGNSENIALMGKALTTMVKPDLFTLLYFHAEARGEIVATKEEADVVFSTDTTPYEIDLIRSDYL